MGVKVDGKAAAAPENPLVPNRVLREMYQKLVEGRLLEERESKSGKQLKRANAQEACRVSVTQGLSENDLVLDLQSGGVMKVLLGMKLGDAFPAPEKKTSKTPVRKVKAASTRLLPFIEDAEARLFAGLGTAMLQKRMKGTDLTVIFLGQQDVSPGTWRRALTVTAAEKLPVIIVVLPDAKGNKQETKDKDRASEIALRCGVPGIPVDASDVVALYRVAQEAIVRIRIGGGAVLIEGLPFHDPKREPTSGDAVLQLGEALLRRQAATKTWIEGVEKSFRKRLVAVGQKVGQK